MLQEKRRPGTDTPPFPLDNSSFSYRAGSQCTIYDNLGHTLVRNSTPAHDSRPPPAHV